MGDPDIRSPVRWAEIAKEAQELEENPGEEFAELVVAFQREGKSYEEARAMADEISQDKDLWLRTMAEKELGISFEETTSPVKDAVVMGLSFIVATLLPIIPHLTPGRLPERSSLPPCRPGEPARKAPRCTSITPSID